MNQAGPFPPSTQHLPVYSTQKNEATNTAEKSVQQSVQQVSETVQQVSEDAPSEHRGRRPSDKAGPCHRGGGLLQEPFVNGESLSSWIFRPHESKKVAIYNQEFRGQLSSTRGPASLEAVQTGLVEGHSRSRAPASETNEQSRRSSSDQLATWKNASRDRDNVEDVQSFLRPEAPEEEPNHSDQGQRHHRLGEFDENKQDESFPTMALRRGTRASCQHVANLRKCLPLKTKLAEVVKVLKMADPEFTSYSVKRGGLTHLADLVVKGQVPVVAMTTLAKHTQNITMTSVTLRYINSPKAKARLMKTHIATAQL